MNNRKKISLGLVALITVLVLAPKAEAADLKSAAKSLDSSLNELIQAKDESSFENKLSEEEEIVYRKKVIMNAIDLSFKEIANLKEKLKALPLEEKSDPFVIRARMSEFLVSAETYYKEAEKTLDGSKLSIENVKDLAKSIKEYRDGSYDPEVSKMLDFIIVFQTERLIRNASDRWEKIDSDIKKLDKANLIDASEFSKMMADAMTSISNAKNSAAKAKSLIIESEKPKEVMLLRAEVLEKTELSLTSRELCESSLTNLKSSYDSFVKISSGVKKSLKIQ